MAEYQPGDRVQVLSGAQIAEEPGLGATIVRAMTDADDYEVEYDVEQPGVSPIVHPDRLRPAAALASLEAAAEVEAVAEAAPSEEPEA